MSVSSDSPAANLVEGEPPCAQLSSLPLEKRPTCIICLGMAGSGKTTFVGVNKKFEKILNPEGVVSFKCRG